MANSERNRVHDRAPAEDRLQLGSVIDHALVDSRAHRSGRVDDLLLELRPGRSSADPPRLVLASLVSGPLARPTARWLEALARAFYRLVGVKDAQPAVIPWSDVEAIDAQVHLRVERGAAGLDRVDDALRRIVRRIPGGKTSP